MAARPAASRSRTQTPQMHLPQCSRAPVRLLQNHCSAAMAVLQYSRVSAAMPPRCGPGDIRPLLAARPKSRSPEVYIYIYIYGGAPERRSFAEHASDSDAPGGRAGPVVCVRRPSDRSRESLSLFLSLSLPLPLSPFLSLSLTTGFNAEGQKGRDSASGTGGNMSGSGTSVPEQLRRPTAV